MKSQLAVPKMVALQVYVLWPDNGIWYKAEVIKVHSLLYIMTVAVLTECLM